MLYLCTMIKKIEALRLEQDRRKTKLCKEAGITIGAYYKYLNGANMPYVVVEQLIKALGYKLIIAVEI